MRKIGFIGAYVKTDLILYVSKILAMLNKKVLVIDATILQKVRYVVPAINPARMYITDFEGIDVAVGFSSLEEIEQYLQLESQELPYDIIFIDTDNIRGFKNFEFESNDKNYFTTSFDVYSLKRGLEALRNPENIVNLTKIYFAKEIYKEDDEYLNFLSSNYKIMWNEEKIYFPIENGDLSIIYENQRLSKIRFRKLSIAYKDGLAYIAEEILGGKSGGEIRRAIKTIEKGG